MTPRDAGAVLVGDALERGLPVDNGLSALQLPPSVMEPAKRGDLKSLSNALAMDPLLGEAASVWPKSLAPALRRFEALPQQATFTLHVMQTAGYVFFVAMMQLVVSAVLAQKVLPVMLHMQKDSGSSASTLHFAELTSTIFLLAVMPVVVWLVSGASGWTRLPGWGRELQRAKEAAVAAALVESQAPADVRLAFFSKLKWLSDSSLEAVELDVLSRRATADASGALARFLSFSRTLCYALLTLNAFGVLASVYVTLAHLAEVGS